MLLFGLKCPPASSVRAASLRGGGAMAFVFAILSERRHFLLNELVVVLTFLPQVFAGKACSIIIREGHGFQFFFLLI